MPYQSHWIPPEIALEYKGVTVYYSYEEGDIEKRLSYLYSLDYHENLQPFFIRDYRDNLPTHMTDIDTEDKRLNALRYLIDAGILSNKT